MKKELDKLYEEMRQEINRIDTKHSKNTLSNKSNKPYWEIEKKYKDKAKKIREKYQKNGIQE